MTNPPMRVRCAQALLVAAALGPVLFEWAGYVSQVSRLSYTLLVPVLAVFLAYLRGAPSQPTGAAPRSGGLLLLGAAVTLLAGGVTGIFTISVLALPLALFGLVLMWGGFGLLRHQARALLLATCLVPIPLPLLDGMNPLLVELSGDIAVHMLRLGDAGATWIGTTLTYDGWGLEVADACSGSGTTLTLLVLSFFVASLFHVRSLWSALLILSMLPISLVVNGARIAGTALCLDWWGVEAATGLPHELLGQALVLGTSALLVWGVARGSSRRAAIQGQLEVTA